jgi:hypothetical protein
MDFSPAQELHYFTTEGLIMSNIYFTVSELNQANLAIERMQLLGFRPEDVLVVRKAETLEHLIHNEADVKRSTILGAVYGFIGGILFGVGQLAYIGHGVWSIWGVSFLPALSGLGWALVGTIVGCSGLLVSRKVPARIEHQLEQDVDESKLVIALPLQDKEKLSTIVEILKGIGASDIYCAGDAA